MNVTEGRPVTDPVIVIGPNCDGVVYCTLACPDALVIAVVLEKVPFAPLSVNDAVTPATGFPY